MAAEEKCVNCGAVFQKENAKFCAKCGFRRGKSNTSASAPAAEPSPAPISKPPMAPAPRPTPGAAEEPEPQVSSAPSTVTPAADLAAVSPTSTTPAAVTEERAAPFVRLYDCLEKAKLLHLYAALKDAGMHDDALAFVEDEDLKAGGVDKAFERRRLLHLFQIGASTLTGTQQGGGGGGAGPGSMSKDLTASSSQKAGSIDNSARTIAPGGATLTPEALETANADALRAYRRGTLLGRGTFGSVYMAMLPTGRFAAVKEIGLTADRDGDGSGFRAADIIALSREITMMRRVKHDNVCEFLGCCYDKEEQRLSLFMELVTGGTMTSLVKRFKPLPPNVQRLWTKQLLVGLDFLHSNHIMHRDIKGENVLVDINSTTPLESAVKLADFGAAKRLTDAVSDGRTVVGTPYWMAPEVVRSDKGYSYSADVWSLGCTIVEMFTGKPAWPTKSNVPAAILMIAASTDGPTELPNEQEHGATPEVLDFLKQCFTQDPQARPSCAQLLEHPWIKGAPAATSAPGGAEVAPEA
jgi:uncharacterized Zn finger protein (UPF0148 family)